MLYQAETAVRLSPSALWCAVNRLGLVRTKSVIPAEQMHEDVVAARAAFSRDRCTRPTGGRDLLGREWDCDKSRSSIRESATRGASEWRT